MPSFPNYSKDTEGASVNTYWEIDQQDVTFWLLKKVNVGNKESS